MEAQQAGYEDAFCSYDNVEGGVYLMLVRISDCIVDFSQRDEYQWYM